jgi:hypothetical protein
VGGQRLLTWQQVLLPVCEVNNRWQWRATKHLCKKRHNCSLIVWFVGWRAKMCVHTQLMSNGHSCVHSVYWKPFIAWGHWSWPLNDRSSFE